MSFSLQGKKIWVVGHLGMVGRALSRALAAEDCELFGVSRDILDLRDQQRVNTWVKDTRPDAIFMAAAKVGGIAANAAQPAPFIYDNLVMATNVIHAAYEHEVAKLLYLGSSCIYPKMAAQPITEDALLTGALEPTNQYYALAKIAGIKLCEAYRTQYGCDFISAMPTNLYGPHDHFDPENAHVIPGLMHRLHQAKWAGEAKFTVWGTGSPKREFLHVDDLAAALILLMKNYADTTHVNVGSGSDITIRELAMMLATIVGYEGELVFDTSKPDGTPRKLLDSSAMSRLGWAPAIPLKAGLTATYDWYLKNIA